MIEIYLFIHPLGQLCYEAECKLLDFIYQDSHKIHLQILPLVNLMTNTSVMKRAGYDASNLACRNAFLMQSYEAALDYKAAQLQGKKYARNFLLQLQTALLKQHLPYSKQLTEQLFKQTGGDLEMFREDRQSTLIKEMFWQDQCTAREMNIQQQTSAVIYNHDTQNVGLLLQGIDELQWIPNLCHTNQSATITLLENHS
ncbi:DsbA family protein [Candidatus Enterococcus willemsii]|uniref:GTP pyrophosphokinase n=1 Tax=Candidatus Enterococcus willemsii TaxID=1857215 RepID=A0ABQ6YWV7_9ENTE|nr:DsbA family protein [Enterococcus sp. CU12B]KAF1302100.1 GTP pyrophosphokinase [Enterococcus sp. CU12B]